MHFGKLIIVNQRFQIDTCAFIAAIVLNLPRRIEQRHVKLGERLILVSDLELPRGLIHLQAFAHGLTRMHSLLLLQWREELRLLLGSFKLARSVFIKNGANNYSSKNMICSSWSLLPKDRASMKFAKRVVSVTLYSKVMFLLASRSCLNFLKSKKSRASKNISFVESGAFYEF